MIGKIQVHIWAHTYWMEHQCEQIAQFEDREKRTEVYISRYSFRISEPRERLSSKQSWPEWKSNRSSLRKKFIMQLNCIDWIKSSQLGTKLENRGLLTEFEWEKLSIQGNESKSKAAENRSSWTLNCPNLEQSCLYSSILCAIGRDSEMLWQRELNTKRENVLAAKLDPEPKFTKKSATTNR